MGEGSPHWQVIALVGVFLTILSVALVVARRNMRRLADAQRALAEREALLSALIEASPAGLIVVTREGKTRMVSRRWSEIVGYTQDEMKGVHTRDTYASPADRDAFVAALQREGKVQNYEGRFRRKDGSEFWGFLSSKQVRIGDEQLFATWLHDITERKSSERERAELSAFLQSMIDRIPNPIFYKGPDTRYLGCNKAYEEAFGMRRDWLVGKRVLDLDFVPQAVRESYQKEHERVLANGSTESRETTVKYANGEVRHALYSVSAFRKPDGSAGGVVGVFVDIEPLKVAERALAQSLDRQKAILETSPHGISVVHDRVYVQVNPSLERMFGYAPGEMVGMPTRTTFESGAFFEAFGARAYGALARGETFADERRMVRKDGSVFWGRITAAALNRSDPYKGALTIYEDVTEAHEAAEALKQALEHQRTILETSPHGIAVTRDRIYQQVNPSYERIFGYAPGELLGRSTQVVYESEESFRTFGEQVYGTLRRGEAFAGDCRMVRKDGSKLWARVHVAALDPADPVKGALGVYEDVTEAHEAAEALKQALENQRAILETSPHGISFSRDRRFVQVNPSLERILGYAPGELIGQSTRIQYESDEVFRDVGEKVFSALQRGETLADDYRMVRKDGSRFWARVTVKSLTGRDPFRGLVAMYEDVTDAHEAAAELRRVLDRQKAMLDASPYGIATFEKRHVTMANPRLEQMFGYSPGEMIGQLSRVHFANEETFVRMGKELYGSLRAGAPVHVQESELIRKDGSTFWARATAAALDRDDPLRGIIVMYEDITEKRAAAEALQHALERQRAIFDASPHGIATFEQRRFTLTSPAMERMFGYAPGEMAGKPARILYTGDDAFEEVGKEVYGALRAGAAVHVQEREFVRKDGSRFWAKATAAGLKRDDPMRGLIVMYEDITEQRAAQQAVRAAHERQEKIFQASPYGIATYSYRTFVLVSPAMERMFGYGPGELAGLTSQVLHDTREDFERAGEDIYARLRSGQPMYLGENWLKRKDGSHFWVRVTLVALDRDDPIRSALGVYEDITERKTSEQALHAAHEQQQAIFRSATSAIALIRDGVVVDCNRRLEELLGRERSQFVRTPAVMLGPDATKAISSRIAQGKTYRGEQKLTRLDGSELWCRISGRAIDPANPRRGSVWMLDDVSEERAAAEALRAASEEQHAIFESVTSGVALVKGVNVVGGNRRLEELFGFGRGEMLGRHTQTFYVDREAYVAASKALIARITYGETYRGEHRLRRKDGTTFWCRLSGRAIDASAPGQGTVWILDDVSEELAAAEALREAKSAAEEAAQAKSMFLANMSHEIRTPMNAVIGMAHLALNTGLDPKQRDYVQKIRDAGTSLLGIINDVLDFSKVEAGKVAIEAIDFSLDEVLSNLRTIVEDKAADKGLGFVVDVPTELPRDLVGDPLRVGQILVNLVNNAVKFTERGAVTVRLRSLERAGKRMQLEIEVHDTGIGMTSEQCEKLFQAFSQADGSITRKYGGTGLGLTICRRLAELMNGTIEVESEPGAGSTFRFRAWYGLGEKRAPGRIAPPAGAETWGLQGVHVLVAEDNEINRQIAIELLESAGAAVDVAVDGDEAVEKVLGAAGVRYDAVLMDVQMPRMGGIEATQKIRGDARFAALPIIAVTSHALAEERQRCLAAGMQEHLTKPVDPAVLFRTLAAWCKTRSAPRARVPAVRSPAGAFPAIAGVDTKAGLKRVAGNHRLYAQLLRQYVERHAEAAVSVRASLDRGDRQAAQRIAHLVRGVSGNIGADAVQASAAALEKAIRSGRDCRSPLAQFEAELSALLASMRKAPGAAEEERAQPEVAVSAEQLRPMLEQLAALLQARDGEAIDLLSARQSVFRSACGSRYRTLEKALNDFNFDAALDVLKASAERHDITL